MYLLELASIDSIPKVENVAAINIGGVLFPGMIDLVEVTSDKPSRVGRGFLPNHLKEKGILQIASSRTMNGCELEVGA